ncbi:MAG TPA: glycine cleavage system protein GcvH [Trueperaceae bacterium]|nr:glycine cleavage system protein GcvH [Trueperaceae bacterium]
MDIRDNLRYATSHEWATEPDGGLVTVGISDYAQDQLGDVVYVELPEPGRKVAAGDAVAVVESVKTASDIYAPVSGTVEAVNEALVDTPEKINESPYGDGWLFRLRVEDASELRTLLDPDAYRRAAAEED